MITYRKALHQIRKVLAEATEEEYCEGKEWYSQANQFCATLAGEYGVSLDSAAAVTAVLSPGIQWPVNKNAANSLLLAFRMGGDDALQGVTTAAYNQNQRKASRIVRGECPQEIVRGPKVTQFWNDMKEPETDWDAPTIDGHVYSICSGRKIPIGEAPEIRVSERAAIIRAFRKVAADNGLLVKQVQAIVWVVWKRLHPPKRVRKGKGR